MTVRTLNVFIDTCKAAGLHVTYQRMAIFKSLQVYKHHPTAEEIYRKIKKEHPTISLATVYKTLEILAHHNLISRVTHLHDAARYDGNADFHHHLVCVECKKIVDVYNSKLDTLKLPENILFGFKILHHRVHFDGICRQCQTSKKNKPKK